MKLEELDASLQEEHTGVEGRNENAIMGVPEHIYAKFLDALAAVAAQLHLSTNLLQYFLELPEKSKSTKYVALHSLVFRQQLYVIKEAAGDCCHLPESKMAFLMLLTDFCLRRQAPE